MSKNILVLSLAAVALLAAPARSQDKSGKGDAAPVVSLSVGDACPDFHAKNDKGQPVTLASWKGKRVVLWFFPKAMTSGCTKEGCAFRDLHAEFEKKGVVVLGVSRDAPKDNAAFIAKEKFPFTLLSDESGAMCKAFGCAMADHPYALRNTYVIGPDGKIEQVLVRVDPEKHPKALLDSLP